MKIALQKHDPVAVVKGHNEDGNATWLLEYYLQTYPNSTSDGKGRFGIKIVRNNSDGSLNHAAETFAISEDIGEVMEMIEVFSKGAVRPHVLSGMVDDWFSEKAFRCPDASSQSSLPGWHTYHVG